MSKVRRKMTKSAFFYEKKEEKQKLFNLSTYSK